jgi:uncharacterized protein
MLYEKFEQFIEKAAEIIKECYGTRLISIILFGSCSRNTQHYDSDIDLLIILSEASQGRLSRQEEFIDHIDTKLEEDVKNLAAYNIHTEISPVIKTQKELEEGHLLLYEMTESCKILYDPQLFMTKFLEAMKVKMNQAGVKKTDKGYWIMPSDIFSPTIKRKNI